MHLNPARLTSSHLTATLPDNPIAAFCTARHSVPPACRELHHRKLPDCSITSIVRCTGNLSFRRV
jgi:hypothetical protein